MHLTQNELREKWLEALESGEYKQTTDHLSDLGRYNSFDAVTLKKNVHYCCLGLATKIYMDNQSDSKVKESLINDLINRVDLSQDVVDAFGFIGDRRKLS